MIKQRLILLYTIDAEDYFKSVLEMNVLIALKSPNVSLAL